MNTHASLNLLTNPIRVKCSRARLRAKHIMSWGVVTMTITGFICLMIYVTTTERAGLTPREIDGIMPFPGTGIAEEFAANLGTENVCFACTVHMGGASPVASPRAAISCRRFAINSSDRVKCSASASRMMLKAFFFMAWTSMSISATEVLAAS